MPYNMARPLVLFLMIGMAAADIGIGYQYKPPSIKYVPGYRYAGNFGQLGSAFSSGLRSENIASSSLNSGSLGSSFGSLAPSSVGYESFGSGRYGSDSLGISTLGAGSLDASSLGAYNLGASSLGSSFTDFGTGFYSSPVPSSFDNVAQPLYQYNGNSVVNSGYQTQYAASSAYQTSTPGKDQSRYHIQQQPTQVFKHFYVHAAPEEPEEPQPRTPIVLPPAQKHYKIIFVKTPTESRRSQTIIPVQPQNEEKTIVYVLVKKPEEEQELIVPKIEQKPPSKPEVFFIKYKNKEDSQTVIDNIVKDYNKGEQVAIDSSSLNNEVINSASGYGEGSYSATSGISDGTYSSASSLGTGVSNAVSGVTTGTYNFGSGFDGGVVSTVAASDNDNSFNAVSAFENRYNTPTQSEASIGSNFNGYSGYGLGSANSGADFNEINIASSVASPITVSTTASSIGYDDVSAISTSQGLPHETYGIPKFRVK